MKTLLTVAVAATIAMAGVATEVAASPANSNRVSSAIPGDAVDQQRASGSMAAPDERVTVAARKAPAKKGGKGGKGGKKKH